MPTTAIRGLGALVICSLLSVISCAQTPQDVKALGKEVVEKSGLHFEKPEGELFEFAEVQASQPCEQYEISWTADRAQELVPLNEAEEKRVPQKFLLKSRSKVDGCGGPIPRFDRAVIKLMILGATDTGVIRGVQLIQQMRDPRMMIVECAQLYGQQPRPGEKCGMFVLSKATLTVRMPIDPKLTKLHLLERVLVTPQQWRWEKLGVVDVSKK